MKIGVILGSGLGAAAEQLEIKETIPVENVFANDLMGKAPPLGHSRRLLKASYKGKELIVFQGRFHFYEGFPMDFIVKPIRYLKNNGAETVILSFACGAIRKEFRIKDFIVLDDHIHFQTFNPLRGTTQFVDCTQVYDKNLAGLVLKTAKKLKLRAWPAVYLSTNGPTYETPAEVKAYAKLGADVVGMSVTAEAMTAVSLGMKVVGLGWVSNMASGLVPKQKLSHQEVLDFGREAAQNYARLLLGFIGSL
ncbi:MAG: purine-nucleoside phosphorylase [Elusimicrobia bacterium]|nr:purine-nucleoside phosphorylase [Elusimicrobiota bacterium]